jgi:hypothetical protein
MVSYLETSKNEGGGVWARNGLYRLRKMVYSEVKQPHLGLKKGF